MSCDLVVPEVVANVPYMADFLVMRGMDREAVDPRFLSSIGVGLAPASFAGPGKSSFGLTRFACEGCLVVGCAPRSPSGSRTGGWTWTSR